MLNLALYNLNNFIAMWKSYINTHIWCFIHWRTPWRYSLKRFLSCFFMSFPVPQFCCLTLILTGSEYYIFLTGCDVPHSHDSSARAIYFHGKLAQCVSNNFLSSCQGLRQMALLAEPLVAHKCLLVLSHRLFLNCSDVFPYCFINRQARNV